MRVWGIGWAAYGVVLDLTQRDLLDATDFLGTIIGTLAMFGFTWIFSTFLNNAAMSVAIPFAAMMFGTNILGIFYDGQSVWELWVAGAFGTSGIVVGWLYYVYSVEP